MTAAPEALHLVRCDDVPPQPWRNGGGRTRELLAWPAGAEWRCRISVAEIDADGPFSSFPGIDRWFAVVNGDGVVLQLPDASHRLDRASPPFAFPGEAAPGCALLRGPTTDLNLMSLRAAGHARMARATAGIEYHATGALHACFSADPVMLHIDTADPLAVPGGTLVWTDAVKCSTWCIASNLPAPRTWWLSFDDQGTA